MNWIKALIGLLTFSANAQEMSDTTARQWIERNSGRENIWVDIGELKLPSGQIFIGDPSWGGDYHMRGASDAMTDKFQVWLHAPSNG